MEPSYPSLQQAEEIKPAGFSPLFTRVQRIYLQQFREWFAITAPTSIAAAVVLVQAENKIREMHLSGPPWFGLGNPGVLVETFGLRFGSYFLAWFLGCFALAAIATVVSRLDGEEQDAPLRDSHERAREHLGKIFQAAVATFIALLIAGAILELGIGTVIKVVGRRHFSGYTYSATVIGAFILVGIVSRLGMAIPLVVRGDIGVWAALNESLKIGERHKGFLYLLLIQSVVGSYAGWYAVDYVLLLLPDSVKLTAWYGWGVVLLSAVASAALQPPMYIGFSLLAEERGPGERDPLQSAAKLPL